MSILNIVLGTAGADNLVPRISYIETNNTVAEILATGFLNQAVQQGYAFSEYDMCLVSTKTTPSAATVQVGWFEVAKSGADTSLSATSAPGTVALPTVANQITYSTDAIGSLASAGLATALFNAGNISAGISGTAGALISFPATAANGFLSVFATNNGGAFNVTLTNAAHGQTSGYVIPDVGNAAGRVLVGATATPFTDNRLLSADGTGGVVQDSGVLVSEVQLSANIIAAQSADIGGGGAGPINIVNASVTANSVIVASIVSSTNTVSVAKVAPGAGSFDVTFDADPGAACVISFVIFVAAQ